MRHKMLRVAAALSALVGAVGFFAPQPASATSAGAVVFTGVASVPGGLFYPCITAKTIDPATSPHTFWTGFTKTKTTIVLPCRPRQSTWAFASSFCAGVKLNANKPGKPLVEGPACSITATGTLSGWCGASSGQGRGSVTIGGHPVAFSFGWTTSAGGALPFTGNVSKSGPFDGKMAGVASVRAISSFPPTVGTLPCVNFPAVYFAFEAGMFVFADPTL